MLQWRNGKNYSISVYLRILTHRQVARQTSIVRNLEALGSSPSWSECYHFARVSFGFGYRWQKNGHRTVLPQYLTHIPQPYLGYPIYYRLAKPIHFAKFSLLAQVHYFETECYFRATGKNPNANDNFCYRLLMREEMLQSMTRN